MNQVGLAPHAPDDYAIVVGINDYPQWGTNGRSLRGASGDAKKFATWLRNPSGGGVPKNQVHLIVSTADPLYPLQPAIDDAISYIKKMSQGRLRRRFYFYFSGHGHVRMGQGDDTPALCLPNWSFDSPGAALSLRSYLNAAVGCLGFAEGVFFLDCCRVRQSAPVGKTSDHECGDPKMAKRYHVIAYAAEHYEAGFEGDVDGKIRGYFSSALLDVLKDCPITLPDLKAKLERLVPVRSNNKQFSRIPYDIPEDYARQMIFGPPALLTPMGNNATSDEKTEEAESAYLSIGVETNLSRSASKGDMAPPPGAGTIKLFNSAGDQLAASRGGLEIRVPHGTYRVRIEHSEAAVEESIEVRGDCERRFELPRRHSSALLSSTIDKKSELSADHAQALSAWPADEGTQAVFVYVRSEGESEPHPAPSLWLHQVGRGSISASTGWLLERMAVGVCFLSYRENEGTDITVSVPVAKGWDTQVFVVARRGRLLLDKATILMRQAGSGFDPRDGLVDAYEVALADLVSGRAELDERTLDDLLNGKFRNPLFGLVGAHFLYRRLKRSPSDFAARERAPEVLRNLQELLGEHSPDVFALRSLYSEILGGEVLRIDFIAPPLLREALLPALHAAREVKPFFGFDPLEIVLNSISGSPWTCWRSGPIVSHSWSLSGGFEIVFSTKRWSYDAEYVGRLFTLRGVSPTANEVGGNRISLSTPKAISYDAFTQLLKDLSVPRWLMEFCRDEKSRANRLGSDFSLSSIARSSQLPVQVLRRGLDVAQSLGATDHYD